MWEGGGAIPPQLGVARRLLARGHDVCVIADPTIREEADKAGCSFMPWRYAPHRTSLDPETDLLKDWEVKTPFGLIKRIRDAFDASARGYARDTVAAIDEFVPDAVLPDSTLLGTMITIFVYPKKARFSAFSIKNMPILLPKGPLSSRTIFMRRRWFRR